MGRLGVTLGRLGKRRLRIILVSWSESRSCQFVFNKPFQIRQDLVNIWDQKVPCTILHCRIALLDPMEIIFPQILGALGITVPFTTL